MRRLTASSKARQRGLTLIELMVSVSVAGILLITGLPYFGEYVSNSRLREGGNSLLTDTLYAQSEAIKRNGDVAVVLTNTSLQVIDRSTGVDNVLRTRTLPDGVSAGNSTLTFGSSGRPAPFGTEYTVSMSMSGVTCSDEHRCPALRVEGGGAIRLCGDKFNCT
jgi:type IV fimbrial biogenesis protein FimT